MFIEPQLEFLALMATQRRLEPLVDGLWRGVLVDFKRGGELATMMFGMFLINESIKIN